MQQEYDLNFPVAAQPIGHRRQQSLEGTLEASFAEPVPLQEAGRAEAQAQFTRLLDKYRQEFPYPGDGKYNVALLVQLFHDFALQQLNKDNILRHFLGHVAGVPKAQRDNFDLILSRLAILPENPNDTHCSRIKSYAEGLVSSLIVPLRAKGGKTPVLSPIFSPEPNIARVGTGKRPPILQDQVAVRDRHRCVISGAFSFTEWEARVLANGLNAADDDGVLFTSFNPLINEPVDTAHIIPHSIGARVGNSEHLNSIQINALNTLHMFDSNLVAEIEGIAIDRPTNALLLTKNWHDIFGQFKVYFDQIEEEPNTYTVRVTNPNLPIFSLPRTVRFESESIPLPSPRLLAVHKALARMMHLTCAGDIIDHRFRDYPDDNIAADGTTDLGALITVGLLSKASIYVC
ncbi:MAG: hypothetical protein M1829_001998 [Trizodia sp. TS-e1964]|nr:MAG: hypothetical protein M1829_001998 [Trizodia sp. TS-e1964]